MISLGPITLSRLIIPNCKPLSVCLNSSFSRVNSRRGTFFAVVSLSGKFAATGKYVNMSLSIWRGRSTQTIRNYSKTLNLVPSRNASINKVVVVGGGLMGAGIAQVAAQTGHTVSLVDVSPELLNKSKVSVEKSLQRIAKKKYAEKPEEGKKFVDDSLSRLSVSTELETCARNADIVVEAITENIGIKHKVFAAIDAVAPPSTIFASNTSSLSIGDIASVTKRQDRFGGLHFFNPVPMMKLLEVIRIPETSDETYRKLMEFGKNLGKVTVTCKDTPGFIVNRLLIPYVGEAMRMYERGDATFEDIDTAMKLGAGYPMGPFELQDYTGLDLAKHIMDDWHRKFAGNPLFEPIKIVEKMVSEGKYGMKSGQGFYKYDKNGKKI